MAFVQGNNSGVYASSSSTALAFTSNNTAGNLLVAFISGANNSSLTISDSQGNTWVNLFTDTTLATTNTQAAWYALNCKGGANTVTVSWTTAEANVLMIAEYGSVLSSSALDQSGLNDGTSATTWTSPSKTTLFGNETLICFVTGQFGHLTATNAPITNVRESAISGGITFAIIADNNGGSAAGTYQGSGAANGGTNGKFIAFIATFRGPTAGKGITVIILE